MSGHSPGQVVHQEVDTTVDGEQEMGQKEQQGAASYFLWSKGSKSQEDHDAWIPGAKEPHPGILPEQFKDAGHSLESVADDKDENYEESNPGQTLLPLPQQVFLATTQHILSKEELKSDICPYLGLSTANAVNLQVVISCWLSGIIRY